MSRTRGAFLKVKGKVYKACLQRVMLYGSETWPLRSEDLLRVEGAERLMIRSMCGVSLKNKITNKELNERMSVVCCRYGETETFEMV